MSISPRRFAGPGPDIRLYLPRNTHWNAAGNQLAAELLFDYLAPIVETHIAQWQ